LRRLFPPLLSGRTAKKTLETTMKKEKDSGALKITSQCRERDGMMYGLKCEGVLLTLVVSPRSNDGDLGEWHVEARAGRGPQNIFVAAEWGTTRIEALRAVGRAWTSKSDAHGVTVFDWEEVARVLLEVRAV
jgi:hypothetical protein